MAVEFFSPCLDLGADAPLKVNGMGQNAMSAAPSGQERSLLGNGSTRSVSPSEWGASMRRRNLSNGGLRFPYAEDGPYQSDPPSTSSACGAVALGLAARSCLSDPKKITMDLRVFCGHTSAQHLERVFVGSGP